MKDKSIVNVSLIYKFTRTAILIRVLTAAAAVFVLVGPLFAQGNAGRILGSVTDQQSGSLPGATVTITDRDRATSRTVTTDNAGEYNAPNLLPGSYSVTAEARGFKRAEHSGITLEVNQDVRVDLQLQIGSESEKIDVVSEDLPVIETTSAEIGGTIPNVVMNELPLNGRNFETLVAMRPGMTIYPGGGSWTQSTDGLRPHDQIYLVDGVNSNDPWIAMSIMNAPLLAGDGGTMLPIEAIDEFKSEINPPAEYGWRPGLVINVGIKSGTNSIHGSAFAYGRGQSFDAREYFSSPPPTPAPPLSFQQFGASLGGPIKKDKLFYFADFEDQRYLVGSPAVHTAPITGGAAAVAISNSPATTYGLQGACLAALAPGGGGVTALSAQIAGLSTSCVPLSSYPGLFLPNNTGASGGVETAFNTQSQIDSGVIKADYNISDKHQLHGSYFISQGYGVVVDNPPRQISTNWLSTQYARSQVAAANWIWSKSSFITNEARVGYSHYYQHYLANDSTQNPAAYNYNGATYNLFSGQTDKTFFGFPALTFKNSGSYQLGSGSYQLVGPDGVLQLLDNMSILNGKHTFKFGAEYLSLKNTVAFPNGSPKGSIRFDNLEQFFSGVPDRASFLAGNFLRHLSTAGFGAFFQDEWHIKPRLTLDLGVRYELDAVLKDANNLLGNFSPTSPNGLVQESNGNGLYSGDHHNFSPRLGFAWDINGNGKTVLRGGGNIIYEQLTNDVFEGLMTIPTGVALYFTQAGMATQAPTTGTINATTTTYNGTALTGQSNPGQIAYNWAHNGASSPIFNVAPACGDGQTTTPAGLIPQPCTIYGVNPNLRSPYISTWTLSLDRALTNNLGLEIAYIGNHGTKLISMNDVNEAPLGSGWTASAKSACLLNYSSCSPDPVAEQSARPYNSNFPYLNYINMLGNGDVSNYNGLQATLTERSAHGLSFVAGYTYSHGLDDSSDNWGILHIPIGSGRSQYGSSDFDIRNRFTFTATYALPGRQGFAQLMQGWSISTAVALQSGLPWGIQDSSNDFSGTGEVLQPRSSMLEQWDFIGKPSDFTTVHGLTNYNGGILTGGTGGVPYYSGNSYAPCETAARALDGGAATGLAQAALANTGCYALGSSILIPPAYGTLGTSPRNFLRDTGYKNWDMSLSKSTKFRERLTAQFRVEVFNILNHPSFANPYGGPSGGAVSNDPSIGPGFGCGCVTTDEGGQNPVLGAGGPRAIQLGLKLLW